MIQDKDYCLTGKGPETEQYEYRIGKNKGLGNVFVWIQPESNQLYFNIPKEQLEAVPKTVRLTQPHCAFLPHCMILFPVYKGPDGYKDKDGKPNSTGQKFIVENDAKVGHNASVVGGPLNPQQGGTMAPKTTNDSITLRPDSQAVSIACNIHGWMKGWARVFDHPYAALTSVGADAKAGKWEDLDSAEVGSYKITGVPVGAKVKLFAWHESAGWLTPQTGEAITLEKKMTKDFKASRK